MSLPDKVSVTATLSVIKTGAQHASAFASVKEVTCYVEAEQKLIGLPSLQGERGEKGEPGTTDYNELINKPTLGTMSAVDDAPSDGSEYVRKNGNWHVSSGGGGGTVYWGDIEGTLSAQDDLQDALDLKADTADLGDLAYEDSVDYSDVTNTPTLGTLASKSSVDYSTEVTNKPTLGALASKNTADYSTDVTNKPTLGALSALDSIDYTGNLITNKPTLGTMAAIDDAPSNGNEYVRKNGAWAVSSGGGGGGTVEWGDIEGNLANQTDLSEALEYKANNADLAPDFDTSVSYNTGDCVIYNSRLYMFMSDKAAGAWDANKAWMLNMSNIMDRKLYDKQDTLTFDTAPTASSSNPVTSGGVKTALDAKQGTLTFDSTPTASSTNPVESGGVYSAIHGRALHISMASTSSLGTISNAAITTTMRVVSIVWGTPGNVASDVTWNTNTAGQLVLSGTLSGATTAEIDLIDFG